MKRGLVNLAELRKSFAKADFTNGKSSYCFIDGDKVIKIYARKYDYDDFPSEVCDLSNFKADTIVFPIQYIYEKKAIVGEISKYINSQNIMNSFNEEARIQNIIDGYELVLEDIYTYDNLDMRDLCSVNILYSNELGFHIIDTTEWQLRDNSCDINIYRLNKSLINEFIEFSEIPIVYDESHNRFDIDDVFCTNTTKFGLAGKELQKSIYSSINNKYDFLRLLYAYKEAYNVYSGREAKTLNDAKELTKVLKKG